MGDCGAEWHFSSLWMGLEINCTTRGLLNYAGFFPHRKKKSAKPIPQAPSRAEEEEETPQPPPTARAHNGSHARRPPIQSPGHTSTPHAPQRHIAAAKPMDYWLRPLQNPSVATATGQGLLWHPGGSRGPIPAAPVRCGRTAAAEACTGLGARLLNAANMAPVIRTSTLMNIHWAD